MWSIEINTKSIQAFNKTEFVQYFPTIKQQQAIHYYKRNDHDFFNPLKRQTLFYYLDIYRTKRIEQTGNSTKPNAIIY